MDMAVMGLVNGVFVMIREDMVRSSCFCSEFGGISVYFSSAEMDGAGNITLCGSDLLIVAHIFNHKPSYADRVAELKALGLLK